MVRLRINTARATPQKGFTLIELLLYVGIVGGLLMAVSYFFATSIEARIKNQTIAEVNQQGAAIMDYLTQTIRNATSITTPAAGGANASVRVVVPTGALSPTTFDFITDTVLGQNVDGGSTDDGDSNFINATKFTAPATGTISTLYSLIGPTLGASPNNKAQMAIYNGGASPTTLLASSPATTLTANAWNAFPISPVSVTSGQTYWLAYNTNGTALAHNNLRITTGTTNQTKYLTQTYGSWPANWSGGTFTNNKNSMYAPVDTVASVSSMRVTEGAGSPVALSNSKVQVRNVVFRNLAKSGTQGVVQISFTLSRSNPNSRNEYDYQKTFTGSAELKW